MTSTKIFLVSLALCLSNLCYSQKAPNGFSKDTVVVNMAALDQPFMYNRMGAAQPTGMIFALEDDIVAINPAVGKREGNVRLRDGKRPRPIVLRANQGDILVINFKNYLRPFKPSQEVDFYKGLPTEQETVNSIYPATRQAGVHILGMQLVKSIKDDGSFVGANSTSLVNPGGSRQYVLFAGAEGAYLLLSTADVVGDGTIRAGQISNGLFGSINVQPPGAEWYRSQVSEADLYEATDYWLVPSDDVFTPPTKIEKSAQERLNPEGFPVINYDATFKNSNGKPILKMYKQVSPNTRELVHSDLTALITGPDGGNFPLFENNPAFFNVPASPDRRQPYREFSIHYHEAPYTVQAFPVFYDDVADTIKNITQTLQGGVDQFAINYGTGGIGAEIYANRIGVGPMKDCVDCAYEEFFLSAWAVGDPAQVVDVPANAVENNHQSANETLQELMLREAALLHGDLGTPQDGVPFTNPLKAATKVFYPDDPSNVYHSYMNDHVKFRISHAGAGITHVHHQHAHQWLHSPNSDKGHYLDSQTINPGSSYTLEMVFGGSGNLNKTVGDQIFHCHFYPHFAQGMWSMWRVHDVLETGTLLDDKTGIAATGARALPDGEIMAGTPIPGLVPAPNLPMAPVPGKIEIVNGQVVIDSDTTATITTAKSPGYPFYIPGVAGQRAPHPPLDFAKGDVVTVSGKQLENTSMNGGLPRSVIIGGNQAFENHTKYDWTKITDSLHAVVIPEEGTFFEKVAMQAHATRVHNTLTPQGLTGNFLLNGLPPVAGAPYADPAVDANGIPIPKNKLRRYKAAVIQVDAVLNKLGWHYPQQRPIVLWGDVASTIAGERPPEPFFMRANSGEFVEYWHSNLVPQYYELDDYQVRTPTDVIGQHIHLVKFDVTSSDGAANGYNYEDGTLSPDLVRDQIKNINNGGALLEPDLSYGFSQSILSEARNATASTKKLEAYRPQSIWGAPPTTGAWDGAQTTIQRWYADPLLDNAGKDRTLRTVFTHDHFGPSTHQQIGLYAALLIEPDESIWLDNTNINDTLGYAQMGRKRIVPTKFQVDQESGVPSVIDTGSIDDGGPTDWSAIIQTANKKDSYREFMFEFQDNQQAYTADSRATPDKYPEFISGMDSVKFGEKVNNEYRGWIDHAHVISPPPAQEGQFVTPELVSTGNRGTWSVNYRNAPLPLRLVDNLKKDPTLSPRSINAAYVFSSRVTRALPELNTQPTPGYIAKGVNKFIFPVQPLSPGMEGGDPYTPLLRAYDGDKVQVRILVGAHVNPHYFNINGVKWYFEPSEENSGFRSTQMASLSEHFEMNFDLPNSMGNEDGITDYLYRTNADIQGMLNGNWGLMRSYSTDQDDLSKMPNNIMNDTTRMVQNSGCPAGVDTVHYDVTAISIDQFQQMGKNWGKLAYNERYRNFDTKAIIYIRDEDLHDFKFAPDYEPEPLVLRANSGDCVIVTLSNDITNDFIANSDAINYQDVMEGYIYNTSFTVGMNPKLVSYDVSQNDGTNVGQNIPGKQTINQNSGTVTYEWYAGQWKKTKDEYKPQPVELGTIILSAPDPLWQSPSGLFGALIIEPEGSHWVPNINKYTSHTSANVYKSKEDYESGKPPMFREFVIMFQDDLDVAAEPEGNETGGEVASAVNYKSEPLASRLFRTSEGIDNYNQDTIAQILSNLTTKSDPETPVFAAAKGTPIRVRLMHPGGTGDGVTFILHGHVWQEEPYVDKSTKLGYNPKSQWFGFRDQLGALNSFDLLISSAGGVKKVPGDYLYRDYRNQTFQNGVWGILRVTDGADAPIITDIASITGNILKNISGVNTVDPNSGRYANTVLLKNKKTGAILDTTGVNRVDGSWSVDEIRLNMNDGLLVETDLGGSRTYTPTELRDLADPARQRIFMRDVIRSAVKRVEPGANPSRNDRRARTKGTTLKRPKRR